MSYDALCRGRHSLHYQIYCITTVTRDRHLLFTDINAAGLYLDDRLSCNVTGRINSTLQYCHKVNRRQAREGALGHKVNRRQAREGALGHKVNRRQARQGELRSKRGPSGGEGPPEEPLGMPHSSPSALGYKVNRRQAREGALGYKVNRRQAREGALGYKVNCAIIHQTRHKEPPAGTAGSDHRHEPSRPPPRWRHNARPD